MYHHHHLVPFLVCQPVHQVAQQDAGYRQNQNKSQTLDHVDLPPSPRNFDKNHEILGFEIYIVYYPYYFLRVWGTDRVIYHTKLSASRVQEYRQSNKLYKIECFNFWQYVLWPPPSPTFVKKSFLFNFLKWGWPPPSYLDNVCKYTGFFDVTP